MGVASAMNRTVVAIMNGIRLSHLLDNRLRERLTHLEERYGPFDLRPARIFSTLTFRFQM